jgi:hypothetical protein
LGTNRNVCAAFRSASTHKYWTMLDNPGGVP